MNDKDKRRLCRYGLSVCQCAGGISRDKYFVKMTVRVACQWQSGFSVTLCCDPIQTDRQVLLSC